MHNRLMHCANCGAERSGPYCSRCGQNDRDYQRALPPLLSELLSEAFELDSRLVRTLKLLLFKPGALSLEFSKNRRASYVSPIRLYFFTSILFFFFLSLGTDIGIGDEQNRPQVQVQVDEVRNSDPAVLLALLDEGWLLTLFKFAGLLTFYFVLLMPAAFVLLAITLIQV